MKLFAYLFKNDSTKLHKKALADEFLELTRLISATESCFNEVENPDLAKAVIFDKAALEARRSVILKQLRELEN